jgi:peroxiredoxin
MWLWARKGTLTQGDVAPDFTLSTIDRSRQVTLSSYRGDRPVVLVFGSYT